MMFFYLLPVAWFFQNFIHEGSHLLFAWLIHKRRPIGLWPYPHMYKGKFYFARCAWAGGPIPGKYSMVWSAPMIGAGLVNALACIDIMLGACIKSETLVQGALAFVVCAVADLLWWQLGAIWGSRSCGAKRWELGDERAKGE